MTEDFLSRPMLEALQWRRLARLLDEIGPRNPYWRQKIAAAGLNFEDIRTRQDFERLPFTTKVELQSDQERNPPYGSNLSYAPESYQRLHQTSGTKGQPLRWLDTNESWQALLGCWQKIFDIVGVARGDRLFFPFSFGPFLGFWTAFEAGLARGCMCLPAGGMSSAARLRMLLDNGAHYVFTTPTYALRLAEVARSEGLPLTEKMPGYQVRGLILAGEAGASIPATRARIEEAWQARVFDHSGMTEVGPMSVECKENSGGLHVLEADYFVEVIDPTTGRPASTGQVGELVVTTLRRLGSPLLRYRTRDLVRVDPKPCPCGRTFLRLEGGILGRTDDMISVRGNNFFPSALEGLLRSFPEIAEFRVEIDAGHKLTELRVVVESVGNDVGNLTERVADAIRSQFMFRAEVALAPPGSLPRFEMKAQRFVRKGDKP